MWELEDIARYFGVSKKQGRVWIVKERCVVFRLRRAGWKAVPVITTDELMKLANLKRPVYGTNAEFDRLFEREHNMKVRSSVLGNLARAAKRKQRAEETEKGKG